MAKKEPKYYETEPTSQVAAAEMLKSMKNPAGLAGEVRQPDEQFDPDEAPYATESTDTDGYVGVSPDYMTHANSTEQPLTASGGVEAELLDLLSAGASTAVAVEDK